MMSKMLATLLAVLGVASLAMAATPDPALFSVDGYRIDRYRSPTPAQADGAVTLDTPALQALLERQPKPLLVDVYRLPWLHGRFVEDEPHRNIPGSLWLPNTGDGVLEPSWQNYLSRHLAASTAGDKRRAIVFYCRSDCWLSWNSIRRARALGYESLYWYRDGIDAWQQAGLPLQAAEPAPYP